MKEYLFAWRFIPKLTLGGILLVEIWVAIYGFDSFTRHALTLLSLVGTLHSELAGIAIILMFIAIATNFGAMLIKWITLALGSFITLSAHLLFKKRSFDNSVLFDLVSPMSLLIQRTYLKHKIFYLEHFKLKSLAGENLGQKKAIEKHFKEVERLLDSTKDWNILCVQSYQESYSQDQRKIELMEDEIALMGSLQIVLLSGALILMFRITNSSFLGPLSLMLLYVVALVAQLQRKRFLARFQIGSYIDVFTVAALQNYSEREGEIRI